MSTSVSVSLAVGLRQSSSNGEGRWMPPVEAQQSPPSQLQVSALLALSQNPSPLLEKSAHPFSTAEVALEEFFRAAGTTPHIMAPKSPPELGLPAAWSASTAMQRENAPIPRKIIAITARVAPHAIMFLQLRLALRRFRVTEADSFISTASLA